MHSPPIEWALLGGHFVALDYLRDRGEPDGDTASEVIRNVFRIHTPRGRIAFSVALTGAALIFHRHICKET